MILPFSYKPLADLTAAVTGWVPISPTDQKRRNRMTMMRLFNIREGFGRS